MKREFRSRERRFIKKRTDQGDCVPATLTVLLDLDYESLPIPRTPNDPRFFVTIAYSAPLTEAIMQYRLAMPRWADMYSRQLSDAGHDFSLEFHLDNPPRSAHAAAVITEGLEGSRLRGHMIAIENGRVVYDPSRDRFPFVVEPGLLDGRRRSEIPYVGWFEVVR